ncbi:unnamed protein product [Effrenium voratum]|uniref:Uncharacterized protein n=1 Tax=Effrenium voratum TaxID=2562239 RepID=A0AA36INF8_9DINO|nr:unnamed protein product [Effrenium voratum]CAJ1416503.1 unnamed protein product [Effrenium voratum]
MTSTLGRSATPLGRSSTIFLQGKVEAVGLANSAQDVLRVLAPEAMLSADFRSRLELEHVATASDLAELDKDDLRELGLGMVERRRVMRWAACPSPMSFLESLRTADHKFGAEGRPLHAVEKAQSDLDLWFSLASATFFPVLMRQLKESLTGADLVADSEVKESSLKARSIRENMLEEHFDLTPERLKEIFQQVSGGEPIQTASALMDGLSRIGVTCSDVKPLATAFNLLTGGHLSQGLMPDELDVILSRMKLAQLLGRGEGSVSWCVPPGRLTLVDYTMNKCVTQELREEPLLKFFFGHRSHETDTFAADSNPQRWLHLRGCHLMLLMALTVKYRLSPMGVEDVIEQGPTKVDLHGSNIFITLDQLYLRSVSQSGERPVDVGFSHLTVILSAPHRPDTLITVVQPSRNVHKDWPIVECEEPIDGDAWVEVLRQRLKKMRSRLAEHDVRFLGVQIVQLCVDNLVAVVRAFAARLVHLDLELQRCMVPVEENFGIGLPGASWHLEVSLIRLQLAVVSRRLRNTRHMLRRLEDMVVDAMDRRLVGYLQDIADDVDGSLEDATHLGEKCTSLGNALEAAQGREFAAQRRQAKEAERIEQEKQNRHAQRLNDILFVLTTATALMAPVQFLAGVYGMNFAVDGDPTIPELKWEYGYLYFWILVMVYLIGSGTFAVRLFRKLRIQQEAAGLLRSRGTFSTQAGESPVHGGNSSWRTETFSSPPYHPLPG